MSVELKKMLDGIKADYGRVASESANIFFGKNVSIKNDWMLTERLHCDMEPVLMLTCSGDMYLSITLVSMSTDSIATLLDRRSIPDTLAFDVLGEFANQHFGLLYDESFFSDKFGQMTQSIPVPMNNPQCILPFIWGIEGQLYIDNMVLYMGFSISENTPLSEPKQR